MTGINNNTLFERHPTNNHNQMIEIMYTVERLINEHYNAVSPSGYILLAADKRLNRVYKRYINRFVTQNGFTMIDKLDPNGRGYVIHIEQAEKEKLELEKAVAKKAERMRSAYSALKKSEREGTIQYLNGKRNWYVVR
ncbi:MULTISPECIES: hypothetical protein [unclassified Photorhabdus]|uniref:hypothetical protein n=1 Tax=unclassified Photorhabdus TaxID=2620880 RepID=UPI000DCEC2F7|nr:MULTISPECIES: hypothetical protein [unclassified Photorhabdus]RAW98725.1 hypothetical protein CKY05_11185 [Photorhabdus sp. S10-54]RAW98817.1 hypothetical protein CKY03_10710 [Photorhabdus sp. S9-53]RAX03009.1 hypothetical protein CKY04_11270 [Photorhabdus sp. S8-52]